MKQIFTLFTALVLIATASQNNAAVTTTTSGYTKPIVSPNPAHDYIKVNWEQSQCDNVTIQLFYTNGNLAKTLISRQYCDGIYSEMFKLAGLPRSSYVMRVRIGMQVWSYKVLIQ